MLFQTERKKAGGVDSESESGADDTLEGRTLPPDQSMA